MMSKKINSSDVCRIRELFRTLRCESQLPPLGFGGKILKVSPSRCVVARGGGFYSKGFMNELMNIQGEQTMSSLQIAELTGKRHDAVLRDVRNLLEQGVQAHNFVESHYEQVLPTGGKKFLPCFNLTKTGCLILASGYVTPKLYKKDVDDEYYR